MSLSTYTGLVSAVQDTLEDFSGETSAFIPTAVEVAQLRLNRECDLEMLLETTTVSGAVGVRTLAKPDDYLLPQNLVYVTSTGESKVLIKQTRSYVEKYWRYGTTSVGEPKYYADQSNSFWVVAPTPDSDCEFRPTYVKRVAGISAGQQMNEFTQNIPEVLYYATMSEMAKFTRNEFLETKYEAQYQNAMIAANNQARRARRDQGLMPANTNINVNTLKGDN
jgi:hypothetical protein